jgi:hypothetical protein
MRCLAVHVYMHERGLGKPCFFDQFAIVPASVLRPAVGVVDQPWNGTSATQSHIQGVAAKLGAHVVLHRPTDNLTGGHILHSSQIEPALIRVDVGDVGQPNDIGCHAVELLFQEVWRWAHLVIAIGGDRLSTLVQAWRNLVLLHYSGHATFRDNFTVG